MSKSHKNRANPRTLNDFKKKLKKIILNYFIICFVLYLQRLTTKCLIVFYFEILVQSTANQDKAHNSKDPRRGHPNNRRLQVTRIK